MPSFRLPPRGGRSGWGLFGSDDNLRLVNLITPERIAAAARLVRNGQVFCLDRPAGWQHLPLHLPLTAARPGTRSGTSPGDGVPIGVAELELARSQAGVQYAPGDIILLHTGFAAWYLRQPGHVKS